MTKNLFEFGGTAFPASWRLADGATAECPGMNLRDWFAGQALIACIKDEESTDVDSISEQARIRQRNCRAKARTAKRAYAFADAMLAERAKP